LYIGKKKKGIGTKDLKFFKEISMEKDFEMSATELIDYGYIIVHIYRSSDINFWNFLKTLELIMQIAQSKNKSFFCVVIGT
jgi:hypothetical protein